MTLHNTHFIHLNVHTNYSLLSGASSIEKTICTAKSMGMEALAITDTNGLYGAIPFMQKAMQAGIRPILGVEIETPAGGRRVVCLARDREGYANLCRIVTARHLEENFSLAEALVRHQEGLFILSADAPLLRELTGRIAEGSLFQELRRFDGTRADRVAGVPPVATNDVHFVRPEEYALHRVLTAIRLNKLLTEVRPSEMAHPQAWLKPAEEMARLFDDAEGREAVANTRRIAEACRTEIQTGRPIFPRFFNLPEVPPELKGETPWSGLRKLAVKGAQERYTTRHGNDNGLNHKGHKGRKEWQETTTAEETAEETTLPDPVLTRLDYELDVIDRLGFSEYFLIVWDIVNFARRSGIPIVGRGSAANSLVAYALGITSADPLAHRLPFERFLNLSRSDCPDIDLDICWRRRDEVLEYVYRRHGSDCVAMVSNHNTFQARSAFRDVARVFGLPIARINRLSAMLPHYSSRSIREAVQLFPEAREFPLHEEPYRTIVAYAEALDGFPRHLSIHIGGIVIGDRPLTHYLPLERAPKGLVIAQYEMHAVEAIGLVKIDLLGHRSLTVIQDTMEAVSGGMGVWECGSVGATASQPGLARHPHGRAAALRVLNIADNDPLTADLLRAGLTIGCFQIESPGMRSLLKMIGARNRTDVIHALSLIRPGPSGSGMKERFIRRRLGEEPVEYLHPRMAEVLQDTYGVMLFQEDILKVAEVVAGFTLEEGDALRQAISKKRSPERIAALKERFTRGAVERGSAPRTAEEIWQLMQNFAGYSYCKAHAVTYGYISYQAAWLKAHYPAEFMAAMMSNRGGFYETREYLEEARRLGVRILPPDVNRSSLWHMGRTGKTETGKLGDWETGKSESWRRAVSLPISQSPSFPSFLRIGLAQVKGLSERAMESILRARVKRAFTGLADFYFRTQVNETETERLILAGALDGFRRTRPQLLWELRMLTRQVIGRFGEDAGGELFRPADVDAAPVACEPPPLPDYPVEKKIALEQDVLGLAVTDHPLRMFERELSERNLTRSDELARNVGRSVTVAGWLVTTRRAVTRDQQYMEFLTLEDRAGTMEVVLFPATYRRFGHLIRTYGPYFVRGRVELNHRSVGLTAEWVAAQARS